MTLTRNTEQRRKILEFLNSVTSHPTAEEVHKEVKKDFPNMTLATAYRNLNLLAELDQILRLEINKEYRYDADISQHQHLVCNKCGNITDSFFENISNYAMKKLQTANFKPESVTIIFRGTCKEC